MLFFFCPVLARIYGKHSSGVDVTIIIPLYQLTVKFDKGNIFLAEKPNCNTNYLAVPGSQCLGHCTSTYPLKSI